MLIKQKAGLVDSQSRTRKAYARPALREFGPVGVLTQSGTGSMVEGVNMQGMCQPNTTFQMC